MMCNHSEVAFEDAFFHYTEIHYSLMADVLKYCADILLTGLLSQ